MFGQGIGVLFAFRDQDLAGVQYFRQPIKDRFDPFQVPYPSAFAVRPSLAETLFSAVPSGFKPIKLEKLLFCRVPVIVGFNNFWFWIWF